MASYEIRSSDWSSDVCSSDLMEDALYARQVSLDAMKHWELTPYNPARVEDSGLRFALTADGAEKDFWKNLRKAIACGLSSEQALRSLTEVPASLIGMENELGTLEAGKIANFMITSSPVFDADNIIYENWVHGSRYVINNLRSEEHTSELQSLMRI